MTPYPPRSCFVEVVRNSGYTESGIYVYDHDDAHDIQHRPIGMIVRVVKTNKCHEVHEGRVYIVQDPYVFLDVAREDGSQSTMLMNESNLIAELDGYDEQAQYIADSLESEEYGVCAKC